MRAKTILSIALVALTGAAGAFACGGGLVIPSEGATVSAAFGSCGVVNGYAVVSASYCEAAVTCSGDYYAICDGTAWSACACSGTWLTDGTYSDVKKPDFGMAPGGDGGGSDGPFLTPVPTDGGYVLGPGGDSSYVTPPPADAGSGEGTISLMNDASGG
jgi:hypothetical protein